MSSTSMSETLQAGLEAQSAVPAEGLQPFGIPAEFYLFALTLLGVALFHHRTLEVALSGLAALVLYKLTFTDFALGSHVAHEGELLVSLFGLLVGFAVLAGYFTQSKIPDLLPRYLPNDWKGPFLLLVMVFALSGALDNIAAAMIGGSIAATVFKKRVHIGFLAALVAASNAGGAGSVVGDTTTTMLWIAGVPAIKVLPAYIAAFAALLVLGSIAAHQQHRWQPIQANAPAGTRVDGKALFMVFFLLAGAIAANVFLDHRPALGVWAAILIGTLISRPDWHEAKAAVKGSIFLVSLVLTASMMPVEALPKASWTTALGMGFVSSIFDNIPLTKLAIDQGGYDWALLAYCVGFGGSMVWFGSSAGVAISNLFPEARSVGNWLKHGWHIPVAYVVGFFTLYFLLGWNPSELLPR